jgi:hypothetical protein
VCSSDLNIKVYSYPIVKEFNLSDKEIIKYIEDNIEMTKKFEALWIAAQLESWAMPGSFPSQAVAELRRLHEENVELLTIIKDLQESASYWCDYEVPVGIVDRMNAAIQKATGETE